MLGDNCGFWIGRWLGPHLLRWFKDKLNRGEDVAVAKYQITRHGGATVFWARYIFGLRTIAAPVAGALGMEWKRFLIFNALGACTWVTLVALIGYAFGGAFHNLVGYFEKASWAISAGIVALGYYFWRREKKEYRAKAASKSV